MKLLLSITAITLLIYANLHIPKVSEPYIFTNLEDISPGNQAALILGAKVMSNGNLSDILKDRTIKAIELYNSGIVENILISGDHGTAEYDEVNAVKQYILTNTTIPQEDIFLDHAGFDTYDSIYRAKEIFQIQSIVIVTQEFHLPRAVYIGNALGLQTYGYVADRQPYIMARFNSLRESAARVKAFLNVTFNSSPKYLGNPIPITGSSQPSWD